MANNPSLHIFRSEIGMFDPFALPNHNVAVHYQGNIYYRRVTFMEAIPPFQCIDLTRPQGSAGAAVPVSVPLAAASRSAHINLFNLEMYSGEFGLFRWYCMDNAQIYLFLPSAVGRNILRNMQVPYDYKTYEDDPNLVSTEIVVWEDKRPAMEAVNGQAYALAAIRVIAMGYRFHSEPLPVNQVEKEKMIAASDNQDVKYWPTVEEVKAGYNGAFALPVYASGLGYT